MSEFPKLTKNIEFLHISRQRIFKNSLTRPCTHVFAQDNTVEKEPFKLFHGNICYTGYKKPKISTIVDECELKQPGQGYKKPKISTIVDMPHPPCWQSE